MRGLHLFLGFLLVMTTSAAVRAQGPCTGWIAVESTPEAKGAILLDGKEIGRFTPTTIKGVPCGSHTIEVKKEFHLGGKKNVKVGDGEVVKASLSLAPNFAALSVATKPAGARVEMDGKHIGDSPIQIAKVLAGGHSLQVSLPDFHPVKRKLNIKPGKPVSLDLKMRPAFGSLQITTKPPVAAKVFVDGDELGTTPVTLKRILSGSHVVRVSKELHKDFETKVNVRDGKETRLRAVLVPSFGTLVVNSKPRGAVVLVDGEERGTTPLTLRVTAGEHIVAVARQAPSTGRMEKKVTVPLRKKVKVMLKLPVRTGSLMVDTVPYAAEIELDGKPVGKAPLSLRDVPVGIHVLVAEAKGLPPLAGQIEVLEGESALAEMNLKEPNKSNYKSYTGSEPKPRPKPAKTAEPAPAPEKKPEPAPRKQPEPEPTPVAKAAPEPESRPEPAPAPEKKPEPKPEPTTTAKMEPPPAETGMPPPTVSKSRPMSTQRLFAWITAGTAVATLGATITFFIVGADVQADADANWEKAKNEPDPVRREYFEQQTQELDDEAAAWRTGGWIAAGVTAAAAGVSVFLFLTEPSAPAPSGRGASLRVAPLEGGGWVGVEARF